jgi:NAD(P)-dependent dehydrogenase (short-subunit alcohol dehydrogenase family)
MFTFADLSGKTLLVTGTTRGIGKGLLPGLLHQGLNLVLVSRNLAAMESIRAELGAPPARMRLYECDLSCPEMVMETGKRILLDEPALDAILHNAAIDPRSSFLLEDTAHWHHVMQVNLYAAVTLTRTLLPRLLERREGRIVFTGSVMENLGGAYLTAYAASKGAIAALTRSLAHELKGSGVTVNCLVPGAIQVEKESATEKENRQLIELQCVPRRLTPDDLLGPLSLLLSRAGGGLSGQLLTVDGGLIHPLADPSVQGSALF